jgi:hypothetical protein
VVYHIMCGYVACVTDCHDTPSHRPHNHTLYDIPPIRFVFQVTQKLPDDDRLLQKHVGASI